MRRRLGLWLPVAAVAIAVAALSHISRPPAPGAVPDWALHGAEFAVLGFTLARALAGGLSRPLGLRAAGWTLALGAAYGAADELHQAFVPPRTVSAWDVAADAAGTAAGVVLAAVVSRARARLEAPLQVTLVTGPGCGLCAQARDLLEGLAARQPLRIQEISVDGSADLARRYARQVPVILVGGQVVAAGKLDEARLAASLAARRRAGERA